MKLTILELIIKGIPEAVLFTFGMYAFSGIKITKEVWKKFMSFMTLMFLWTYIVRLLPINYGVNLMLVLVFAIFFGVMILKIPLSKCVKAALISAAGIVIGEGVNMLMLQGIYGAEKTQEIIGDPILKVVNTIPSSIVFGAIITVAYYFNVLRIKEIEHAGVDKENFSDDLH